MESKRHRELAEKIARIKGVEYHSDKGVDVRTSRQFIEIEVDKKAFGSAKQQLAGTTKSPYIAVPKSLINAALESVKGTRFGVMDENAKIHRRGVGK